jgi:HD-like signal output (HDOD) protein
MPPDPVPSPKYFLGPDDLVRKLDQLPSAPTVLPRLLTVLNDTASSMLDVVSLIKLEPGTAARVLRIGNSAFYSKGGRCESLAEAVNRIGFLKIYEVVAFSVSAQLLMRDLDVYGVKSAGLWQNAIACALSAEVLAPYCELDSNLAYTAGLFHGVGMVAIDIWSQTEPAFPHFVSTGYPKETTSAEEKVLGFTNASAAAALLRAWTFPHAIIEAVRWQYSPKDAGPHKTMACLVNVAKYLRTSALSADGKPVEPLPEPWIMKAIRLEPETVEDRVAEVRTGIDAANQLVTGE